jgi:hypothetical protein
MYEPFFLFGYEWTLGTVKLLTKYVNTLFLFVSIATWNDHRLQMWRQKKVGESSSNVIITSVFARLNVAFL